MVPSPCRLKLDWGERAECRMNPLRPIDGIDELPDRRQRIWKVAVLREVDLLFVDGPDDALGIAVLPWFADRRHPDLDPRGLQGLDIPGRRILKPLVTVVHEPACGARAPAGGRSKPIPAPTYDPAASREYP